MIRRNPLFSAVAIASLALGIGVNTAIFSLIDQLLLWRVPARDPARLVTVEGGYSESYPFFREYRDRNQVFSAMFASSRNLPAGMRPAGAPTVEVGHVQFVTGDYFQGLGVGAAAGRIVIPSDDGAPGGSPVAVLSYEYWQRRFGGDLKVLGRKLAVNGSPLEIAGIAQRGFTGIHNGERPDAFIPLAMYPVVNPSSARAWNTPNMFWLTSMARLKPGVTKAQAQAAMQVLWPQAADAVNAAMVSGGGKSRKFREGQITLSGGVSGERSRSREALDPWKALAIAAGLVLLIACANVANLLLSRANARRKEIAVRLALGATRGRLVRQLLAENMRLAAIGGVAGIALAWWGVEALARISIVSPDFHFRPSATVLLASLGITAVTGLLFGLAPAFRTTRVGLAETIKDAGGASPGGSRLRLAKVLVAAQVALSVALLVGAGLFIRTLRNVERIDLGFRRENVVVLDIDPTNLGYRGHRLRGFYDNLLDRVRALPGVRAAALTVVTPLGNYMMSSTVSAEGYEAKPDEYPSAMANSVTSGYFTSLGVPMLLGRDFRAEDEPAVTPGETLRAAIGRSSGQFDEGPNGSRVCIIDEILARKFFGSANPIGRHLSEERRYTADGAMEIIGVVRAVRYGGIKRALSEKDGMFYLPSWSHGAESRWVVARVAGDAAPVIAAVTRELRAIDANVPLMRARTLEEYVDDAMWRERLIALLCGLFGVLALALAAVGLYGVMAYAVTRRTREVGIRMALGAQPREVLRMVVIESLTPVALGMAAGLGAALAFTRLLTTLLYGVAPRDPLSMAAAAGAMLAVAAAAAAIPARRASRVEPVKALRYE
jgi:predicted permease